MVSSARTKLAPVVLNDSKSSTMLPSAILIAATASLRSGQRVCVCVFEV